MAATEHLYQQNVNTDTSFKASEGVARNHILNKKQV